MLDVLFLENQWLIHREVAGVALYLLVTLVSRSFYSFGVLVFASVLMTPSLSVADDKRFDIKLLAGSSWQVKNDVQIPSNEFGTRFSLADTVGEGPLTAVRLEFNWRINEKHGLRVMLAPLSYEERVEFEAPVEFNGASFAAGTPTTAGYRFNSWRVGYHYTIVDNAQTTFRLGGTLKVRDAEIRLEQEGVVSADDDLGLVPLLHLATERRFNNRWFVGADFDALAGGPGRAIDAGVTVGVETSDRWRIGAELRVLEGGADIDRLYNFAQFNSASVFLGTRW
jgi:hypothetical protein